MRYLTPLLPFLLSSLAIGQTPASFTPYGSPCNGSPMTACVTQNDVNPALNFNALPNEYAYPVINTSGSVIQVVGFDLFTGSNTAVTETVNTAVHRDASGPGALAHTAPDFTAEAVGTITVANAQGWYTTMTSPAVTLQPGEAFWIAQDCFSLISASQNSGGVAGPASPHWRRPNYQSNAWVLSGSVNNPIFKIHCLTGSPDAPALLATGLPQLGQNFELEVSRGTPFLLAYLVYSFHNTQWLGLPTPVNLGIFGAPDCFNYTNSDFMILIILDAAGTGTTAPLTIPNDPNLAGVRWFNQAAALTPGVNSLDLLVTNAATVILGT